MYRHPYILSYIDATETDENILLVTEPCTPLDLWLKKIQNNDPSIPKSSIHSELTWGFKCVLQALEFLHNQASLLHGNISPQSIFITPNGDWKLASFELAANFNNQDDITHFMKFQHIISSEFISPERKENSLDKMKAQIPPFYVDIYSFGKCLLNAYSICNEEVSGTFGKYVALTVSPDFKKRPSGGKLLAIKHFNSDYIKIMDSIQVYLVVIS